MTGLPVTVEHLNHRYRTGEAEIVALDDVSFHLPAGSSTAVMGPSGSGKSTLTTLLAGLHRPTSGRIRIGSDDITTGSRAALLRLRAQTLAVTVQRPERNLLPYASALDNLRFAQRGARRYPAHELPDPRAILDDLHIRHLARSRADHLSGGERQRLSLAVGLAIGPAVLLTDEPTSQLDAANRDNVADLLLDSSRRHGVTLISITHDTALAQRFERLLHLQDGRLR